MKNQKKGTALKSKGKGRKGRSHHKGERTPRPRNPRKDYNRRDDSWKNWDDEEND